MFRRRKVVDIVLRHEAGGDHLAGDWIGGIGSLTKLPCHRRRVPDRHPVHLRRRQTLGVRDVIECRRVDHLRLVAPRLDLRRHAGLVDQQAVEDHAVLRRRHAADDRRVIGPGHRRVRRRHHLRRAPAFARRRSVGSGSAGSASARAVNPSRLIRTTCADLSGPADCADGRSPAGVGQDCDGDDEPAETVGHAHQHRRDRRLRGATRDRATSRAYLGAPFGGGNGSVSGRTRMPVVSLNGCAPPLAKVSSMKNAVQPFSGARTRATQVFGPDGRQRRCRVGAADLVQAEAARLRIRRLPHLHLLGPRPSRRP